MKACEINTKLINLHSHILANWLNARYFLFYLAVFKSKNGLYTGLEMGLEQLTDASILFLSAHC